MLIPATRYADPEAALAFLTGVLELAPLAVHRDAAGAIVHAEMRLGTGVMMFGPVLDNAFGALMVAPRDAGGETTTIYAVVADAAGLHERVAAKGAEIVQPPEAQAHGGTSFTLRDPEGHVWTFGEYVPPGA